MTYKKYNNTTVEKDISKKIFYVFGWGSLDYRESKMSKFSLDSGFDCQQLCLTKSKEVEEVESEGVRLVYFPVDDSSLEKMSKCTSLKMVDYINQQKPDLIVFKGFGAKLYGWLVLRINYPFRYVFIVGGRIKDPLLNFSSYVLFEHKKQIEDNFIKKYRGGVDILPKLLPDYFNNSNLDMPKKYDIVCVGRFAKFKNFKALIPFFPNYKVALIGDGETFLEIKKEADKYPGNVYMPGLIPGKDVYNIVKQSKIIVHPSLDEGFPRVIAEAMACGVPPVVFKPVISSGFEDGVHGVMIEEISEESLINAVVNLLSDKDKLEEFAKNCVDFARENFSQQKINSILDTMYEYVFTNTSKINWFTKIFIFKSLWLSNSRKKIAKAIIHLKDRFL